MGVLDAVRTGVKGVAWYVRGVMGEDAYRAYLAHVESGHACDGEPVMTEREFWRDVTDRQDKSPQGRCC
jgi:uncharacterized short protein YbdD (DUF466 family)